MRYKITLALTVFACWALPVAAGEKLEVGPGKKYAKPSQAIAAAKDGDTIEIDAAGKFAAAARKSGGKLKLGDRVTGFDVRRRKPAGDVGFSGDMVYAGGKIMSAGPSSWLFRGSNWATYDAVPEHHFIEHRSACGLTEHHSRCSLSTTRDGIRPAPRVRSLCPLVPTYCLTTNNQ